MAQFIRRDDGHVTILTEHPSLFRVPADFEAKQRTLEDFPRLPVPHPAHKDDILPQTSAELLLAQKDTDFFMHATNGPYTHHDGDWWIPVKQIGSGDWAGWGMDPPFPADAQIAWKIYWDKVASYTLVGPIAFSRQVTRTDGISDTQTQQLSAELGAEAGGLSAKLSAMFSDTITISSQTQVTTSYSFAVDPGKTVVWTLWQLIEVFALVDKNGHSINPSGVVRWYAWDPSQSYFYYDFPQTRPVHRTPVVQADAASFTS